MLARAPGTLPPTTEPIGPSSGQEIYGLTNAHGEAAVIYNTGQIAGAKTVTARVDDELSEEEYNYQIRQVEFNIDGSGRTTPPPADDEDEDEDDTTDDTVTPSVPSSVTGPAGGTARLRLPHLRPQGSQLADSMIASYRRISEASHGQAPLIRAR